MRHSRDEIVREFFSEECEVIGEDNLEPILRNLYRPVETEYGENMPVVEFIGIVVAAVGFIDASLSLHDRAKANISKNEDGADAFVALARSELKIPTEVDDRTIELVLRRIASSEF